MRANCASNLEFKPDIHQPLILKGVNNKRKKYNLNPINNYCDFIEQWRNSDHALNSYRSFLNVTDPNWRTGLSQEQQNNRVRQGVCNEIAEISEGCPPCI